MDGQSVRQRTLNRKGDIDGHPETGSESDGSEPTGRRGRIDLGGIPLHPPSVFTLGPVPVGPPSPSRPGRSPFTSPASDMDLQRSPCTGLPLSTTVEEVPSPRYLSLAIDQFYSGWTTVRVRWSSSRGVFLRPWTLVDLDGPTWTCPKTGPDRPRDNSPVAAAVVVAFLHPTNWSTRRDLSPAGGPGLYPSLTKPTLPFIRSKRPDRSKFQTTRRPTGRPTTNANHWPANWLTMYPARPTGLSAYRLI